MLCNKPYGAEVDVWSIGVCLFEFMCGPLPFGNECGEDQLGIFKAILTGELEFPHYVDDTQAMDLMRRFLTRVPEHRVGCGLRGF